MGAEVLIAITLNNKNNKEIGGVFSHAQKHIMNGIKRT
jgi:hypothetical protein